jgi:transcriptional regulator of acetoin/glycerol metabolism
MAIALCDGGEIKCAHLPADIANGGNAAAARLPAAPAPAPAPSPATPPHLADDADTSALNAIQVRERETVLSLLDEHRWNVSNVAKVLGISRNTLYRKMHRLHIRLSHDGTSTQADA